MSLNVVDNPPFPHPFIRTQSNVYGRVFFAKIVNGFYFINFGTLRYYLHVPNETIASDSRTGPVIQILLILRVTPFGNFIIFILH